jgi:hypothetical protein
MRKPLKKFPDSASQREVVPIQSCDFWVKIVEMLQQNWALIDTLELWKKQAGAADVF